MQRHIQQDLARKRKRNIILIVIAVVLLIFVGIRLFKSVTTSSEISVTQLPISASYNISPFGNYVLYYDGMSLHCITTSAGTRWSHQLGADAGFHTDGKSVVAWSGSQVYILNSNGTITHNESLGAPIQFARVGGNFAGIIIGDENAPHLYIVDLDGTVIDQEINAYDGFMLLNIGFFGENGQYMWTLSFDVAGSAPDTILNTFQVGQKNTGNLSLGDALVYAVIHDNENLKVVNTRQIRTFDYRGTENLQGASLVYGWRLIDSYLSAKGTLSMLYAPSSQTGAQYQIGELRLISGNTDTRYTLPTTCVGATVVDKQIYAFSDNYVYITEVGAQRFKAQNLKEFLPGSPKDFLGITADKVALLVIDDSVYAVKLP